MKKIMKNLFIKKSMIIATKNNIKMELVYFLMSIFLYIIFVEKIHFYTNMVVLFLIIIGVILALEAFNNDKKIGKYMNIKWRGHTMLTMFGLFFSGVASAIVMQKHENIYISIGLIMFIISFSVNDYIRKINVTKTYKNEEN